jgi:hypothetical protein
MRRCEVNLMLIEPAAPGYKAGKEHVMRLFPTVISKVLQERDELREDLADLEREIERNRQSPVIKNLRGLGKFYSASER